MRSRPAACFQSPHRGMQAELISSPRRVKCTLRWCPGGREGALKEAIAMCARRPRGPGGRGGALKGAIVICGRRPRGPGGREGALKAGKAALAGCAFALAGCEPVFAFAYFFRKTDARLRSGDVNPYSLRQFLSQSRCEFAFGDGFRISFAVILSQNSCAFALAGWNPYLPSPISLAKQLRLRSRGM